jgi:DNA-binding NarL/FixJ family response regulator
MDLCMPRMDGVQATRILRRQQPDTPVVLWTGDDDAQLEQAVCTSGAQVGIPKHIGTVALVATLREACAAQDKGRTATGGRPDSRADASVEGLTAADGKPSSSSRRPTDLSCAGRSGARSPARSPTADSSWLPPTMYY